MALENIPHYILTHNLNDYPGARAKVSKSPYFTFNDNYSIIPENYYPIVQSRNPYAGLLQIPKLTYSDLNLPSRSWEPKFSKINTALDFENKFIKPTPTTYQPFTNNPYYRAMNIGLSGLERGNNIVKMQRALGLNKSNGLDGDIANVADTAGLALSGIGYLTDRKKPNPYKTMGLAADGGPVRKFGIGGNILGGLAGGLMGIGQGIQNARLDVNPADVASTINQQRLSATGPEYAYDGLMYDYANTPTLRHLSKRDFKNSNALSMIGGALSAAGVGYNTGENLSKTFDSMLAKRNSQENTAACGGRLNNKYWLGGLISAGVGGISSLIGSLFGNNKAKRAANEANARIDDVNDWNNRTLDMRLNNINSNRFDLMERSYMTPALEGFGNYAFGGHLFSDGGPKNPKSAYGADWSNGVSVFNTGGTHEQNPHEGVQVGIDPQGTPNLVEEGEVEYNDYVYSNRIEAPEEVCQMLGIKPKAKKGKKKSAGSGYTYADIAKRIQKESEERPNDPISKRGLEAAMGYLAQAQEQQKAMQEQQDQTMLNDILMAQAMQEQPSMEGAYGASGMQEMGGLPQLPPLMAAFGGKLFANGGNLFATGGLDDYKDRFTNLSWNDLNELWKSFNIKEAGKTPWLHHDWEEANKAGLIQDIWDYANTGSPGPVYNGIVNYFKNKNIGTAQGTETALPTLFRNSPNNLLYTNHSITPYGLAAFSQQLGKKNPWEGYIGTPPTLPKEWNSKTTSDDKMKWFAKNDPTALEFLISQGAIPDLSSYGLNIGSIDPITLYKIQKSNSVDDKGNITYADLSNLKGLVSAGLTDINELYDSKGNVRTVVGNSISPLDLEEAKLEEQRKKEEETRKALISNETFLRYFPPFLSASAVFSDLFGLTNNPDYTRSNMALNALNSMDRINSPAIGNYYRYTPTDVETGINALNADSGASRGYAIDNAGGNRAVAAANIAAIDNKLNDTKGDYILKAKQADDAGRLSAAQFNNSNDIQNNNWALDAQSKNMALDELMYRGLTTELAKKDALDEIAGKARSANLSSLATSLGSIGKEAAYRNLINSNPGLYYALMGNGQSQYVGKTAALGGYLNLSL